MGDYYQTLGVDRNASAADIKAAYRKLAMKYHPDRNQGDKDAEHRFKEVQQAYQVLGNPEQRQTYDQFGEAGVSGNGRQAGGFGGGAGGFGINIDDIFGDAFGDIFRGGERRSNRGQDRETLLTLDFMEAAKGCEKQVQVPQVVECETCNGSGAKPGTSVSTCGHCHGQGHIQSGQGFFSMVQTCPYCRGTGQTIDSPCTKCHGEGRVSDNRSLKVKIPPGVDNGMRIRLSGGGDAGPRGGQAGDLYVHIRIKPHPLFKREDNNLILDVVVPITVAVLGKEIEVPTLTDKVRLKIPVGTQNGTILRLRNKGIDFNGQVGDMLCRIKVEVPVKLNQEQKELFKQLDESIGSGTNSQQPNWKKWINEVKNFIKQL